MRKVLGVVAAQVAATFATCLASSHYPAVGHFCRDPLTMILCLVILCPAVEALAMKPVRRSVPLNYVLLACVTLGEAVLVSAITAELEIKSVVQSIAVLCIVLGCLWMGILCAWEQGNVNTSS